MDLVWRPFGLIATTAGLLAWTLAAAVYLAQPRRAANRRLALFLVADGTFFLGMVGLPYFTMDPRIAYALLVVGEMGLLVSAGLYLSFLGTLETWLVKPFRKAGPWIAIAWTAGMLAAHRLGPIALGPQAIAADDLDLSFVPWFLGYVGSGADLPTDAEMASVGRVYLLGFFAIFITSIYGLVASMHAWLSCPKGAARQRNRLVATAFACRDLGILLGFGGGLVYVALFNLHSEFDERVYRWLVNTPMIAAILFVALIVYAILRSQVFDIEIRLKRGIPKGVFAAFMVVGFVVVSEVIEAALTAQAGLIAGIASAVVIALAFRPIERLGARLAQRALPHVEDTEAYRAARRAEVYRDAFEAVLGDGRVMPYEEQALAALAQRLGLDEARRASIEDAVRPAIRAPPGA